MQSGNPEHPKNCEPVLLERNTIGFPQFGHKAPTMIASNESRIKEFPICTTRIAGKELAYSGGGYFRFFPLGFIQKEMKRADYAMTYFHINDLVQEMNAVLTKEAYEAYFKEPGTLLNRYKRYVKSNLGKKSAFNKLIKLINTTDFVNLEEADLQLNWDDQPLVIL